MPPHSHPNPLPQPLLLSPYPPSPHPRSTPAPTTPHARFLALLTRHPAHHTSFIYSVLTTRIYCRPTCPSRLARRANIIFHDSAAEAVAAGFRPCKRCRPDVEGWRPGGEVVARAKALMREGKRGLGELSQGVGMSRGRFARVWKGVVRCSVGEWVEREEKAGRGELGKGMEEGHAGETRRCEQGGGGASKERAPGAEAVVTDTWLLDTPTTTIYPVSENECLDTSSHGERWDLFLADPSLLLQYDFTLETAPLGLSPDVSTSTDNELSAPVDYIPDIDIAAEGCPQPEHNRGRQEELWWEAPTLEWDAGWGPALLDMDPAMVGFESMPFRWSHDVEGDLFADGGWERV